MNKCAECKYASKAPDDKPDFVKCNLRLPSWVAGNDGELSQRKLVLNDSSCSFYEHPNAWMAQVGSTYR